MFQSPIVLYVEGVKSSENIRLDGFPAMLVEITGKTIWARRLLTGQIFYCLLNLIFCEGPVKFKARQLPRGV